MKRSLLVRMQEWLRRNSKKPWACIETTGVVSTEEGDKVMFLFSYNEAFVTNLRKNGFSGIDEEEIVKEFLIYSQMIPAGVIDPDPELDMLNRSESLKLDPKNQLIRG